MLRSDTIIQLATATVQRQSLLSLRQEHWRIMGYLLDKQSIQALAAAVALSHDETIRVVQELINLGIIEVAAT
jgi:DNA-binding Lrp family transcriptional regulator